MLSYGVTCDVLLARLGPSMLNRKILVCPEIEGVDKILASTEFIVIRPHSKDDAYYIAGICRSESMLEFLYSKCRGATPSRYRLSRDDMEDIPFPVTDEQLRREYANSFKESLV